LIKSFISNYAIYNVSALLEQLKAIQAFRKYPNPRTLKLTVF